MKFAFGPISVALGFLYWTHYSLGEILTSSPFLIYNLIYKRGAKQDKIVVL
jgi:hypothetical protein